MKVRMTNKVPGLLLLATIVYLLSESQDMANISTRTVMQLNGNIPVLVKEGENITDQGSGFWEGYVIPRGGPVKLIFRNNIITSINSSGYMLQAGDENPSPYNNNLENEIISGNKFIWNGTGNSSITHGVFTGYNRNALIIYNYLYRAPMALIRKSDGMADMSGGIAYNIVNDPLKTAVAIKGMSNVKIYNNTFYSERQRSETWRPLVHIYANDKPEAPSKGTMIYNNIFYTKHRILNITVEEGCLEGFECDYNIYFCEDGEPLFLVGGQEKTFTEWRSLGYDLHSQVLDPRFNNYNDFVPAERLDIGKDLGAEWKTGLSVKAVWNSLEPETTDQNGKWQVGARIYGNRSNSCYYISTEGDDNNSGTITHPFASWQKGFSSARPGDTVFLRGGIYHPGNENRINIFGSDFYCGVCIRGVKGTPDKPINVKAFPGEKPVLDCSSISCNGYRAGLIMYECDYWHIKGLRITKAGQVNGFGAFGIYLNNCSHNTIEQIVSDHHGGSGIRIGYESEDNLILNCDAYNCYDSLSISGNKPYHGGHADGMEVSDIFERNGNERVNRLTGCRSWNNSDDGYDFFRCEGVIIMEDCWAWKNGYDDGDGSGFKLGTTKGSPEIIPQRILKNCIAYSNSGIGFDQNGANVIMKLENCKSYSNGTYGFNFQWNNVRDTLTENISFRNGKRDIFSPDQIQKNNSWQKEAGITESFFVSISPKGLDGPRGKNGYLPRIKFLKPKKQLKSL